MANVRDYLPLSLAPSSTEGHVTLKAVVQQDRTGVCVCVRVRAWCACVLYTMLEKQVTPASYLTIH